MAKHQTSYVRNLADSVGLYQKIDEAIARRVKEAETDRASLERYVNQALKGGNFSKASELMQPYADKYVQKPVPVARPETVSPARTPKAKSYDEALSKYVAAHPKQSYAKQELKDYMKTQIPRDRRINSALIALEMKKLGFKAVRDDYVKKARTRRR